MDTFSECDIGGVNIHVVVVQRHDGCGIRQLWVCITMITIKRRDPITGAFTKSHKSQDCDRPKQVRSSGRAVTQHRRELVGTALKSRIEKLITIKTGKGCGCQNLATQMDNWGLAGCEQRRAEIVAHLVGNREILIESLGGWSGFLAGMLPDIMLRAGAGMMLDQAIADVRSQVAEKRQARPQRQPREYTGWRSIADGPMLPHGPFVSTIRHLTYFVYARTEDSWKWNLQQLSSRWWLFNGTRILGIAFDNESASAAVVMEYAASLGMVFDHVLTAPNSTKLREVVLWLPMMKLLKPESAGADEVVFSAHAKGQKYDDPSHTRNWTELMYMSCLDDWEFVEDALHTTLMAGSFREFGLLSKHHNWAYSGTFFWWRLQEIGKRRWHEVDQWFAGTESWPSKMCDPREVSVCFLDQSTRLYIAEYWSKTVWAAWYKYVMEHMQREANRIGGPRCNQHWRELAWLCERLPAMSRILVIGSFSGGLEHQLHRRGHSTVSIDIEPQPDNVVANMIVGSSSDVDVQRRARDAGLFDVVFIDGDHSYAGVKSDWLFALTLRPRVIAIHDIAATAKHHAEGCYVDQLWQEIRSGDFDTEEIHVGHGWGGIGIVRFIGGYNGL